MRIDSTRLKLEVRRARGPFLLLLLLVVACGVTLAVVFRNLSFDRPWVDYYETRAAFTDVKGVVPGQHTVRISGVKVGVINKAELVNGRPVLTLKIERKYGRLYRNARLRLRPVTPLQDMYVSVEDRGTPSAGVPREEEILSADSNVVPVDVSRVLQTFDADTRQHLTALLHGLGRGLDDGGEQLRAAFVELAPFLDAADRMTGALANRRRALQRLVTNLGDLTAALARRDDQLTSLIRDGQATMGELARNGRAFDATLAALPPTFTAMRDSFGRVRALEEQLDPALVALRPAADALEEGLAGLERFAGEATPALSALRRPVRRLEPLAETLPATAQSLDLAFQRLEPEMGPVNRITGAAVPCLRPLQKFFGWTMSVGKYHDAYAVNARSDVTVSVNTAGARWGATDPVARQRPTCAEGGGVEY